VLGRALRLGGRVAWEEIATACAKPRNDDYGALGGCGAWEGAMLERALRLEGAVLGMALRLGGDCHGLYQASQ
jgi:hypothetical protein